MKMAQFDGSNMKNKRFSMDRDDNTNEATNESYYYEDDFNNISPPPNEYVRTENNSNIKKKKSQNQIWKFKEMSSSTLPQIRASKEGLTKLRSNNKGMKPSLDPRFNQDEYENSERKGVKKNHQALEQTMEEMNKRYAYNMKNIVSKL